MARRKTDEPTAGTGLPHPGDVLPEGARVRLGTNRLNHVIQRGNNRQAIFFGEDDCQRYRDWLAEAARACGCAIHAYVLMTNHVHLLVTPETAASLPALREADRGKGPTFESCSAPGRHEGRGGERCLDEQLRPHDEAYPSREQPPESERQEEEPEHLADRHRLHGHGSRRARPDPRSRCAEVGRGTPSARPPRTASFVAGRVP